MPLAPDVVLSFSHTDRDVAEGIASQLSAVGLKVRWDEPIIAPDEHREKTAAAIRAARAVIVLWTRPALDNRWVVEEADEALRLGKLVSMAEAGIALEHLPQPFHSEPLVGLGDGAGLSRSLRALGLDLANDLPVLAAAIERAPLRLKSDPDAIVAQAVAVAPIVHAPGPSAVEVASPALSEPAQSPQPAEDRAQAAPPRPRLKLCKRMSVPADRTPALGLAAAVAAVVVVGALLLSSGLLLALTN